MIYNSPVRRLADRLRPRLLSVRSQGGPSETPPPTPPTTSLPLQLLGFEVDPINAGQLTSHNNGQRHQRPRQQQPRQQQQQPRQRRRQIVDDDQVEEHAPNPIDRLSADHSYSHIINGYIGSRQLLIQLALLVRRLKRTNPALQFVCDPVMGDHGPGLYVPADLVPIYQDIILPLADVCVPNQFEAELLTGHVIRSEMDALHVMEVLHERGVGTVILSSTQLGSDVGSPHLLGWASQRLPPNSASSSEETPPLPATTIVRVKMPRLQGSFVGAGELFTELSTAWLFNTGGDLRLAMEKSASSVQAVLRRTLAKSEGGGNSEEPLSRADIEDPPVSVVAEVIQAPKREEKMTANKNSE